MPSSQSVTRPSIVPAMMRARGDAKQRWFYGGGVHTWLATAADTGGAFLLFEDAMEKGKRTPLHTHPGTEETMYVLEGEILMHMNGNEQTIGAGGVILAPRDVPHAFLVTSASAAVLTLQTPGLCEAFYMGASAPLSDSIEHNVDFGRIAQSARDNGGIDILGPPPFPE